MIPKLDNKTALIFIGISILVTVIGLIIGLISDNSNSDLIVTIGLSIGQLSGLIMLIRNGTLMNTIYWKIISFLFGLLIIGALFKIQHWVGSNIIISIALGGITITYSVRFIAKKQKTFFDILKIIWVVTAYIGTILVFQHIIKRELMLVAHSILWITIIYFIVNGYTQKTLFKN